ncbi:MAG: BadF/BadG/BcrA/BcrD ATPase family protein [Pseudomonadota bacterium]
MVVIDGGGTGSRLRAIDADGGILAETSCGPSNLTYGVDEAWRNLRQGLAKLSDEVGLPVAGTRLWCGFAGGRSPTRQAAFRAANPVAAAEITIVTDGFASLIGAHQGGPGIVLAVGTGVAAFALTLDGHVVSSSAWGYKIGDEGSGGWIGNRAVSLLARHLDGRLREESALFSQLQQVVGEDFDAIQLWLSDADATAFAALAPLVLQAAEAGDTIANRLLTQATHELVVAVQAVDAGQPIALLGGLAQVMEPRLRQDFPNRIIPAKGNALDGLQIIAARGWRDETRVTFEIAS